VPPTIDELEIADPPDAWEAAGFAVDDDGTCRAGTVRLRLTGRRDDGKGVRSWALRDAGEGPIDGLVTTASQRGPADPAVHVNGTRLIDHVVVASPDIDRTVRALCDRGFEPRRERRTATYGAPMRQVFFRMGEVILELIGPGEARPDAADHRARFFGLAFTVDDLDATKELLGDRLGDVKDAVQPGRRISTLRHKELGISTAIAFMSDGAQEYE
jgi:hypothetical protein